MKSTEILNNSWKKPLLHAIWEEWNYMEVYGQKEETSHWTLPIIINWSVFINIFIKFLYIETDTPSDVITILI